jgi:hypothetical protein
MRWPSADAWLLLAVGGSGRRSLRSVIGAADAINHAIPTYEEFDAAAKRLSAARLLEVSDDELALTAAGSRLLRSIAARSWHDEWSRLEAALGEKPRPDELDGHGLSQASFEEAVAKYLHSHGID